MLIIATIFYILSSAVTTRRDQSIFYNRYILVILTYTIYIAYMGLNLNYKNIGLFNNFFSISPLNTVFNVFIFVVCLLIINLSSFYPRKIILTNKLFESLINKSGEIYKLLEYPLIILFVITGAVFLNKVHNKYKP